MEEQTVYCMKEKLASLSGDSFTIKDEAGDEKFNVDGTSLSIREKKTLSDSDGNELYQIKEELINFSLREKQYILDAESEETLFTLRKAGVLIDRNTVNVFEGDDDEGEPCFVIAGGFMEKEFEIADADGVAVCQIDRRAFNIENMMDKDTYAIQVEEGQDAALMIAFAVAVDEMFQDD